MTRETPMINPDGSLAQFMPKIDGKSFRCECLCNVFHKPDFTKPDLYACNACGIRYVGTPKVVSA